MIPVRLERVLVNGGGFFGGEIPNLIGQNPIISQAN